MTLMAGAFAYKSGSVLDSSNLNRMRSFFEETVKSSGTLHRQESADLVILKWDSGALEEPAWLAHDNGSVVTLSGDPLVDHNHGRKPRREQLSALTSGCYSFELAPLGRTRGVFSALAFDSVTGELQIATDMIGIRPVYYAEQGGVLYFSSTLHLLESLPRLTRTISDQGLAEHLTFSFSLADRTPYREIFLLPGSTLLRVGPSGLTSTHYFDWSSVTPLHESKEDCARRLFTTFNEAVRLRLDNTPSAQAFLSGGMDSRSIVASLIANGSMVNAMNFSPEGSQDQAFATEYAKVLGRHCSLSLHPRPDSPNFSVLAAQALLNSRRASPPTVASPMRKPMCIWSGDGGSVCLGYVYLDDNIMEIAKSNDWHSAARAFLEKNKLGVPAPLFSSHHKKVLQDLLLEGVVTEMRRHDNGDPGRGLYFFLLLNDQRRHLFRHFESIHQHRLEFHLPFFDTQFVRSVIQSPVALGLMHRLYSAWFSLLPENTRQTPWQTYPGHEKCPVPSDKTYGYQWDTKNNYSWSQRFADSKEILTLARRPALRTRLSMSGVAMSALTHELGLRDLRYLAKAARKLHGLHVQRAD